MQQPEISIHPLIGRLRFIDLLEQEPFDQNSLKRYGLKNENVVELLKRVFG